MTDDAAAIREAVSDREAWADPTATEDGVEARVTTTPFEATARARPGPEWRTEVSVTVTVPTLSAAVDGDVGSAVQDGWLETLERRLEDAPKATRANVELDEFAVDAVGDSVRVTYEFALGDAGQGLDVAKTFVEYVEGTYLQGVVPGYEYEPPVSTLLSDAQQSDGGPGGTPL